eukprot:9932120-Alexandrium_andersonii.AAC.1
MSICWTLRARNPPPRARVSPLAEDRGALGSVAARVLMKILWVARVASFDLLRVVGLLATKITKWTSKCDRRLSRLVGYMKATTGLRMIGWVGDSFDAIEPHLFADADFAGC